MNKIQLITIEGNSDIYKGVGLDSADILLRARGKSELEVVIKVTDSTGSKDGKAYTIKVPFGMPVCVNVKGDVDILNASNDVIGIYGNVIECKGNTVECASHVRVIEGIYKVDKGIEKHTSFDGLKDNVYSSTYGNNEGYTELSITGKLRNMKLSSTVDTPIMAFINGSICRMVSDGSVYVNGHICDVYANGVRAREYI